jgi:hypothetical protein
MVNEITTDTTMQMAALGVSLFGAAATIIASLIQLRIAWRKELQERVEHKPVNKKTKRGPVRAIVVLMIASAVGGFALSQYWVADNRKEQEALELDLRSRIDTLSLSAKSLESVRLSAKDDVLQLLRIEEAVRRGKLGVTTIMNIAQCKQVADNPISVCIEEHSQRLQLCAELPVDAVISKIEVFARPDDGGRDWQESQVTLGADFGGGRFDEKPVEQNISGSTKQLCQGIRYWNTEVGTQARVIVHYVPNLESQAGEVTSPQSSSSQRREPTSSSPL